MKYIADNTNSHIGNDTWHKLSHKQRAAIKRNRVNAAKLVTSFMKEKDLLSRKKS